MDITENLRNAIGLLGFNKSNGRIGLRMVLFLLVLLMSFVNGAIYLINQWENVNKRINGMRAIVFQIILFTYALCYISTWHNFDEALKVVDNASKYQSAILKFEYFNLMELDERLTILDEINKDKKMLFKNIALVAKIYMGILNFAPLFVGIIQLATENPDVIDNLPLPYPFYYPKRLLNYKSVYAVVYVAQSLLNIYALYFGYVSFCISFICMGIVESSQKLISLTLSKFNVVYISSGHVFNTPTPNNFTRTELVNSFIISLVRSHQNIYQMANISTKVTQSIALNCNYGISILLCMTLYLIVETNDPIVKISEVLTIIPITYVMYLYGSNGQKVTDENEKLMTALYNVPWIEMPRKFKKALLLIMTMNKKTIEIKPFGLQVLNLKHFSTVMNAAYSYYNIINTTRYQ